MKDDQGAIRRSAAAHYSRGEAIWSPNDEWNTRKRQAISSFCREAMSKLDHPNAVVLNAGSGSHRYDWMPAQAVSLDRFPAQLAGQANAKVGDLERMPFPNATFDLVICVGSVLNYVSAIEALTEIARVTKPGGELLLHYESSDSLEHLGRAHWRADVAPIRTLNNGKTDMIWVYSRAFIRRTLDRSNYRIKIVRGFHIGSAALLRLGLSQQRAARAQRLDTIFAPLRAFSDDVILIAQKGVEGAVERDG